MPTEDNAPKTDSPKDPAGQTSPPPASKTAPKAQSDDDMVSIATTVPRGLKTLLEQRAAEEERQPNVLTRRAIREFMQDWKPGTADREAAL